MPPPSFEHRKYPPARLKKADWQLRHIDELTPEERSEALDVLVNFRALHYAPLNTFQATLRQRIARIGAGDAIIAQRIKRMPTILEKLRRFPEMSLRRMQDIGGLRAIVGNMKELNELHKLYTDISGRLKHKIVNSKDYVAEPKTSGYRGRHLVFRYVNDKPGMEDYNGLYVELQLRTRLQHTWATAVETFEAFLGEKFKSSEGDRNWLEFFALVSSAFALKEGQPVLAAHAGTSPAKLYTLISQQAEQLRVLDMISSFRVVGHEGSLRNGFVLLVLDTVEKATWTRSFAANSFAEAYQAYEREERRSREEETRQVVLVRTNDIKKLSKAYPNYFADLESFKNELKAIVRKAAAQA